MSTLIAKLVGMNFYKHALQIKALLKGQETLLLVREPDNPHDPNAVEVYIKIGHIEREKAAILADSSDPQCDKDIDDQFANQTLRVCIPAKTDIDGSGALAILVEV